MVNILYITQHIKGERELNKVTLYQTTKSEHLTCSWYVAASQLTYDDVTRIRGSDEFISKQEVKKLQYPVQKYVFSQKDWKGNVEERTVYAAFDNELLELIQCERSKFQRLNDEIVCRTAELSGLKNEVVVLNMDIGALKADKMFLENECLQLKTKLSKIAQMKWWKRIVFILKGVSEL